MARERNTDQFLSMVRRMIAAAARRVGEEDEFELAELIDIGNCLDEAIADAIVAQRRNGKSWAAIATATGTTRQAAHARWSKPRS